MSNFPNMSYVAFENTVAAMRQVLTMMEEARDAGHKLSLSSSEQRAFTELFNASEAFVTVAEDLEELPEEEENLVDEA